MTRTDNSTGALLMMAAMAALTINDMFLKLLAGQVPLFQVLFVRGALTGLAIGIIAWRRGVFRRLPSRHDALVLALRTLAEVVAAWLFLTALFHMPLANVTAILQVLPLSITLAAALFFGDPVGWRRLLAIAVGFGGVVLIVRPGAEGFNVYSLYALAAVACVTVRDLTTRRLSRAMPSMLVAFATTMGMMVVFGIVSLGRGWVPMAPSDQLWLLASSVAVIGGYMFSIMAIRVGDVGFTTPFRYTGLIWALVLGWAVFGEWPGPLTLLGAAIVVGSGLFTLYREARPGRKRSVAPHLGTR